MLFLTLEYRNLHTSFQESPSSTTGSLDIHAATAPKIHKALVDVL